MTSTQNDAAIAAELQKQYDQQAQSVTAAEPTGLATYKCGVCATVHLLRPIPNSQFQCTQCQTMNQLMPMNGVTRAVVIYPRSYYYTPPLFCSIS